uniref:Uncharacterized protein n=1 Tax=Rhizophora mucronata TaxID=61149 RepID=A0A2P2QV49_RHIMU
MLAGLVCTNSPISFSPIIYLCCLVFACGPVSVSMYQNYMALIASRNMLKS